MSAAAAQVQCGLQLGVRPAISLLVTFDWMSVVFYEIEFVGAADMGRRRRDRGSNCGPASADGAVGPAPSSGW